MGEHKIRADGVCAQDGNGEDPRIQIYCDWDKAGERDSLVRGCLERRIWVRAIALR